MTRRARVVASIVAAALGLATLSPSTASAAPIVRNPGLPRYVTELSAGGLGHVWKGTHRVAFTNLDADPLGTIYLRLWSNGVLGCAGGSIEISNVSGGSIVSTTQTCTAVEIALDAPLAPGARTTVAMDLRIELPEKDDRFGYHGGLTLVGTALPTLAIHDDAGWHLDPFEDLGESFYSIVGAYRVTLEAPVALDTPATGLLVDRTATAPGREARTYVARDVRDFAWAAARLRTITKESGGARIVVSYQSDAVPASEARARLADAVHAIDTFSSAFGAFPYPEMDVVLAGHANFGGMEYPTIIFTEPLRAVVAHELAHQWWYGIVGDDEFHEPWLDESFATWSASLPFDPWRACLRYRFPGEARLTNDMAYWADHPGQYGTIYSGGGCLLANLAHRFGLARFVHILHAYAAHRWFGVARTAGFTAAIERAAARDLPDFDPDAYWAEWRVG